MDVPKTKNNCEPFGEIVDESFLNFNRDARGLDIHGEQENEEISEEILQNDENEHDPDEEVYHGEHHFNQYNA